MHFRTRTYFVFICIVFFISVTVLDAGEGHDAPIPHDDAFLPTRVPPELPGLRPDDSSSVQLVYHVENELSTLNDQSEGNNEPTIIVTNLQENLEQKEQSFLQKNVQATSENPKTGYQASDEKNTVSFLQKSQELMSKHLNGQVNNHFSQSPQKDILEETLTSSPSDQETDDVLKIHTFVKSVLLSKQANGSPLRIEDKDVNESVPLEWRHKLKQNRPVNISYVYRNVSFRIPRRGHNFRNSSPVRFSVSNEVSLSDDSENMLTKSSNNFIQKDPSQNQIDEISEKVTLPISTDYRGVETHPRELKSFDHTTMLFASRSPVNHLLTMSHYNNKEAESRSLGNPTDSAIPPEIDLPSQSELEKFDGHNPMKPRKTIPENQSPRKATPPTQRSTQNGSPNQGLFPNPSLKGNRNIRNVPRKSTDEPLSSSSIPSNETTSKPRKSRQGVVDALGDQFNNLKRIFIQTFGDDSVVVKHGDAGYPYSNYYPNGNHDPNNNYDPNAGWGGGWWPTDNQQDRPTYNWQPVEPAGHPPGGGPAVTKQRPKSGFDSEDTESRGVKWEGIFFLVGLLVLFIGLPMCVLLYFARRSEIRRAEGPRPRKKHEKRERIKGRAVAAFDKARDWTLDRWEDLRDWVSRVKDKVRRRSADSSGSESSESESFFAYHLREIRRLRASPGPGSEDDDFVAHSMYELEVSDESEREARNDPIVGSSRTLVCSSGTSKSEARVKSHTSVANPPPVTGPWEARPDDSRLKKMRNSGELEGHLVSAFPVGGSDGPNQSGYSTSKGSPKQQPARVLPRDPSPVSLISVDLVESRNRNPSSMEGRGISHPKDRERSDLSQSSVSLELEMQHSNSFSPITKNASLSRKPSQTSLTRKFRSTISSILANVKARNRRSRSGSISSCGSEENAVLLGEGTPRYAKQVV